MVLWGAFILVLIWAVVVTIIHFKNPTPLQFPDKGHRVFGVKTDKARKDVVELLGKFGLEKRFTFVAEPTTQTLLNDNMTVIHYLDPTAFPGLPGSAISVVVDDPAKAAAEAAKYLRGRGYSTNVMYNVIPELPQNNFVLIKSNAFCGWNLAFRLPLYLMPKPKEVAD